MSCDKVYTSLTQLQWDFKTEREVIANIRTVSRCSITVNVIVFLQTSRHDINDTKSPIFTNNSNTCNVKSDNLF